MMMFQAGEKLRFSKAAIARLHCCTALYSLRSAQDWVSPVQYRTVYPLHNTGLCIPSIIQYCVSPVQYRTEYPLHNTVLCIPCTVQSSVSPAMPCRG